MTSDGMEQRRVLEDLKTTQFGRVNVCISLTADKTMLRAQPLFLYHGSRTGGVAFQSAMQIAYKFAFQIFPMDNPPRAGRIERESPGELLEIPHIFVGTHAPYGFHHKLSGQGFGLLGIFRDPVKRLSSCYTKACMRGGLEASIDGLSRYIDETPLHDYMVGQLCGLNEGDIVSPQHLRQALETLDQNFIAFCDTERSPELLNNLITSFNLPNVIQDIPNRTVDQYKVDTSPVSELVKSKNQLDYALIDLIAKNPRIPAPVGAGELPSSHTVVMYESEKIKRSDLQTFVFPTEIVVQVLKTGLFEDQGLSAVADECMRLIS